MPKVPVNEHEWIEAYMERGHSLSQATMFAKFKMENSEYDVKPGPNMNRFIYEESRRNKGKAVPCDPYNRSINARDRLRMKLAAKTAKI